MHERFGTAHAHGRRGEIDVDATALTFGMQQGNSTLSELSITCTPKSISGTTDKSPSDGTNNRIRKDGGGRHAALRFMGSFLVPH